MQQCHFCKSWFNSRQAVRGHLRWCRAYQADEVWEPLGSTRDEPEEEPLSPALARLITPANGVAGVQRWP